MTRTEHYTTKPGEFPRWPISSNRETELLTEVVESGKWWRMTGTKVKEFEKIFAKTHGAKHCLAVTNGTHALELVLAALGLGRGDEVIVPAFTFISTFTAPMYSDVTPIPVDVDKETFCMTKEAFEKAITPKTKAVIPVHMAGHMCDMEGIREVAKKHGIKVVEDAAHAHGASYLNKPPGYYSDAAIFSFQNGKIMTCGEGGAIITNCDEIYEKLFLLHGVGRPKNDIKYEHLVLGTNDRMSEFQAAVLIAQLERLDAHNNRRTENAEHLNCILEKVAGIRPQTYSDKVTKNTHYMYMFYYEKEYFGGISREKFVKKMNTLGIPAFIAYPVVCNTEFVKDGEFRGHISHSYKEYFPVLENAMKIADDAIWLPHFTLLGDKESVDKIKNAILQIQLENQRE